MLRFIHIKHVKLFTLLVLLLPAVSKAVTLDEVLEKFPTCEFKEFFYAPWDSSQVVHAYFTERNIKPYKEDNGVYYFKVDDTLYGLPVSELVVPGTWNLHGVIFDLPLNKVRVVLKRKFGTDFVDVPIEKTGDSPKLQKSPQSPEKSVFFCAERSTDL